MERMFEELDYQQTARGELILRRRKVPMLQNQVVYEVILNGEFLMSSLFHAAEDALAHLAIGELAQRRGELNVLVGGLGLGHTAASALDHPEVARLEVIDIFPELIDWHRRHLVPLGERLCRDPRCRIIEADFFAGIAGPGFHPDAEAPKRYDAILLDIDHSPGHWLHPEHAPFYRPEGLAQLHRHLVPDGLFALWADGKPDIRFVETLQQSFTHARAETITFDNPITGGQSHGTVYLAKQQIS